MNPEPSDERTQALHKQIERVFQKHLGQAVVFGDDLTCLYVNPAFRALSPRPEIDPTGQPYPGIWPPDEGERQADLIRQVLRGGEEVHLQRHTRLDPDGTLRYDTFHIYKIQWEAQPAALVVLWDMTDLVNAEDISEQALRESLNLLRSVMDGSPDPIFLKDGSSRILLANPATLEILGKTLEQVIGKSDREIYADPAVGLRMMQNDARVINSGQMEVIEEKVSTSQGERIFLSTKTPYRDVAGNVIGVIGISRDITERKGREDELNKLNRTLKALGKSSQVMMRAQNLKDYMDQVCKIVVEDCGHAMVWIGFTEEDPGKTVRPVAYFGFEAGYLETLHISWADTQRGRGPTGTAIRTGKPSMCRNMLTDPNFLPWREQALKRGYASSMVLPLLADEKAFGAITIYAKEPDAFSEDEVKLLSELANDLAYGITTIQLRAARDRAESALRVSEGQYRSIFNGMTEGFALHEILCDEADQPIDYRFLDINPSFELLTGLKRNEVVGRLVSEVLPDNDPYWVQIYGKVALTGQPVHFENYSSPLKQYYDVFAYCPAPRQFAVLFLNITERKNAEAAIESYARQLESRNRELQDFTSIASHDLQEPLRKIKAFSERLIQKMGSRLDEQELDYIERMKNASVRMGAMINSLLDYSRVTTKAQPHSLVDLNQVVTEVLSDLEIRVEQSQGKIEVGLLGSVEADPLQMRQLFQNLIGNALKFAKPGEPPQVKVYSQVLLDEEAGSGSTIKIFVEDNGIGFEMTYADQLFQPFHRLVARSEFEGTGMGLAICRKIIEGHGGSITAHSAPGQGSTFIVSLPVRQA